MNPKVVRDSLIREEGEVKDGDKHILYRCSENKLTIGHGWNIEDNGIPDSIARELLEIGITSAIGDCHAIFDRFAILDDDIQEVFVEMAFQLGRSRLYKFENMIKAARIPDRKAIKREMLDSKWARQVPARANRLAERVYS